MAYGSPYDPFAAGLAEGETAQAEAGTPLPEGAAVAGEEAAIEALRTVHDPEIPVNIYDLGLIYDIEISKRGDAWIEMTVTAPACPVAGEMPQMVADAVAAVDGIGKVTVDLVWDPPWTPERMSDEARVALNMF